MTTDSTAGRGRWREGRATRPEQSRGPTAAKKWVGATVLSALLVSVLGVVGWLFTLIFFRSEPHPIFIPFWIAQFQKEQIPPIIGTETERAL